MLFGDEPRFYKDLKPNRTSDISGYGQMTETSSHVGPGAYYSESVNDKRNGWASNSFSKRQPMSPNSGRRVDRNHHYTAGHLCSSGIIIPGSPNVKPSPGPGYYGGSIITSPTSLRRPTSADTLKIGTLGKSPRVARSTAVIRNGILFESKEINSGGGPGYYNAQSPSHQLIKKSHNVRVQPKTPLTNPTSRMHSNSHMNQHRGGYDYNNGFESTPSLFTSPPADKIIRRDNNNNNSNVIYNTGDAVKKQFYPHNYVLESFESPIGNT